MSTINPEQFNTPHPPTWCPGCGDWGIWQAIKQALAELELAPHQVVIVYGIGCSGNMNNNIRTYGFHSLHGRTLPVAVGVKLANNNLKVLAVAGDGDAYAEGTSHLIHIARTNSDISYFVCNNHSFSLTTGQASPTSAQGYISKTTPQGEPHLPFNPLTIALSAHASFVARGFAGDISHLTNLIKKAIQHKGFALLDILQPCVTFNKLNTSKWYQERIYKLEEEGYDFNNKKNAWSKAQENERLPIGVFYQEKRSTFTEKLKQIKESPLFKQSLEQKTIVEKLLNEFQ